MVVALLDNLALNSYRQYAMVRDMNEVSAPEALILVSNHCPHCHALEWLLRQRLENGVLGKLEVINVEQNPGLVRRYGVRSVPWFRLCDFVFVNALEPTQVDEWIEYARVGGGQVEYIAYLLEHGGLSSAIEWLEKGNVSLDKLVPLFSVTDIKMNVRIGAGAIMEHFEGSQHIRDMIPELLELLHNDSPAIRIDACHYLSLTHSSDVQAPLKAMLDDEDAEVRQVAQESLENLLP